MHYCSVYKGPQRLYIYIYIHRCCLGEDSLKVPDQGSNLAAGGRDNNTERLVAKLREMGAKLREMGG